MNSLWKQLQFHYDRATYGTQEPDLMHCHPRTAVRFVSPDVTVFKFNNALLRLDESTPIGEVFFENSTYPEGKKTQKYNVRFTLE